MAGASERGRPFPKDPQQFDADERVAFSRAGNKYILEDENGDEWEWFEAAGKWCQPATEEEALAYQQAFGGPVDAEEESVAPIAQKRKEAPAVTEVEAKKPKVQENRAIFVTNLPHDVTVEELALEFGRYGVIDQSVDGSKRIKLYYDEKGNFKGEALVVYFKSASVRQAVALADNYWFRPLDTRLIGVQEADHSYKRNQDTEEVKTKMQHKDKKANERNRAQLNKRLAEWSDDDEISKETLDAPKNKWAKFVIIKNAFTLSEISDVDNYRNINEDIHEEAEKVGDFVSVDIYDNEPEGIIVVQFKDPKDAETFKNKADGVLFGGPRLSATIAESRPRFRKADVSDEVAIERMKMFTAADEYQYEE